MISHTNTHRNQTLQTMSDNPDNPNTKKPKTPKRRPRKTHQNNAEWEDKTVKTPKPRTRTKPSHYTDDDDEEVLKPSTKIRRIKGTILASNKPSYCLKLGIGSCVKEQGDSIRSKHRKKLRKLLKKLIRRHNWVEASGVLSVLLKATPKDKSIHHNRIKYWATLELMKHIKGDTINSRKIQNIYEVWMKKVGSMKNWTLKDRFAVQLEFILFCLTRGNVEDAHQASLCLMQERGFESDPISNLIVGLTFYDLWYSALPKEWQLTELNKPGGFLQPETPDARTCMSIENSDGYDAVESQEDNFPLQTNSITSVANDKDNMEVDSDQHKEVSMDAENNLQGQTPHRSFCQEDFYVYPAEGSGDEKSSTSTHGGDLPYASIFYAHGLPPWLLPLQLPSSNDNLDDFLYKHRQFQNDHYKRALKHLRQALHSTPPVVEALHPLIQMLLLGDKVNEALEELENFFHDSDKALKLRLKAGLLEHFDRSNYLKLCACYEDILEVDPTCSHSLTRLVNMHCRGDYSTEKLVKMIALHLDATYAECNIWKEFASCLLKLSLCAGDQMSMCLDGGEEESEQSYSAHVNQIPELFTNDDSGNDWRFRCRWWLSRHFNSRILASEIAAGDLQLLTWKASAAAFLYGRDFRYVVKVLELLEKENMDMYSSLQMHVQNSVGFCNLNRT